MKRADAAVIGGSAAGIPAAISCRRRYPQKSVILIRKEERALIPCGLPYIFGTLGDPKKDLLPDAMLTNNNVELVKGEVVEGYPSRTVVDEAASRGADVIFVGSHGWSGIKRFLMGSVATSIVKHAKCSVMVVRQGQKENK